MHPQAEQLVAHSTSEQVGISPAMQTLVGFEVAHMLETEAELQETYARLSDLEAIKRPIEEQIHERELERGIHTATDRLLEAQLVIDAPLLNYAVITSQRRPERTFGDKTWADHLDARTYLDAAGNMPLDVDMIMNTQKLATQRSNPTDSGRIRVLPAEGGRMDNPSQPATYGSHEIGAIAENQLLSFRHVPAEDVTGTTGFIVYPHQKMGEQTRNAIKQDLADICSWYNTVKLSDQYDPYALAAELQQRLVTVHPFQDANGRVSRLLMNWSLTNDDLSPSVLSNPNNDLTSLPDDWAEQVREGSERYTWNSVKKEALGEVGIEDLPAVQNVANDQAFYEYIYRHIKRAPLISADGDAISHEDVEEYMIDFYYEQCEFEDSFANTNYYSVVENGVEHNNAIKTGGLIPSGFISFATSKRAQSMPAALIESYFGSATIYRGGRINAEAVTDTEVIRLMQGYSAFNASYRANDKSLASPTSLTPIAPQLVKDSMDYYNKSMAIKYLQQAHPRTRHYYTDGKKDVADISALVAAHSQGYGNLSKGSPFVSTSFNKATSQSFGSTESYRNQTGILITARAPLFGNILTFEADNARDEIVPAYLKGAELYHQGERELAMVGALLPSSVQKVEIKNPDSIYHSKPALVATRSIVNGTSMIEIEDAVTLTVRTYVFNSDTATYDLQSERSNKPVSLVKPWSNRRTATDDGLAEKINPFTVHDHLNAGALGVYEKYPYQSTAIGGQSESDKQFMKLLKMNQHLMSKTVELNLVSDPIKQEITHKVTHDYQYNYIMPEWEEDLLNPKLPNQIIVDPHADNFKKNNLL